MGTGLGQLGGYFGGVFDALLMRVMDVLVAFPALLAIALMTMLGGSLVNVALAIAIIYVPIFARIMRSSVLAVSAEQCVQAVRAVGAGHGRTILWHILPNSLSATIVQTSLAISDAILIEAALSYLGLGVTSPTPSLGALLTEGQGVMTTEPWMVIFPGLALTLGVLGRQPTLGHRGPAPGPPRQHHARPPGPRGHDLLATLEARSGGQTARVHPGISTGAVD